MSGYYWLSMVMSGYRWLLLVMYGLIMVNNVVTSGM